MWEHCGVIKNKLSLESGLNKLYDLKNASENIGIPIDSKSCKNLLLTFDLKASIVTAEATMISALERKESRGAHQRSDYQGINNKENINYRTKITDNKLSVYSLRKTPLEKKLALIINKANRVDSLKGKLIE